MFLSDLCVDTFGSSLLDCGSLELCKQTFIQPQQDEDDGQCKTLPRSSVTLTNQFTMKTVESATTAFTKQASGQDSKEEEEALTN